MPPIVRLASAKGGHNQEAQHCFLKPALERAFPFLRLLQRSSAPQTPISGNCCRTSSRVRNHSATRAGNLNDPVQRRLSGFFIR